MSALLEDARRGLRAPQKWLPPVWFYDEMGSKLFEHITAQPEYYPTETERGILVAHADDILDRLRLPTQVAELGAGSSSKTVTLLEALLRRQQEVRFCPIDVSVEALRLSRDTLEAKLPGVRVDGIEARNREGVRRLDWGSDASWLVLFLGSSIGNLDPAFAKTWLAEVCSPMRRGDAFILGVDRAKDAQVLHAAYNDAAGVTAAFNLNLLDRLNRELGADFDPASFEHEAFYAEAEHRVEMHLRSRVAQRVNVPGIGEVPFAQGETIHTENSYKYTDHMLEDLVRAAGLREMGRFTDARGWFDVLLLERAR